MIQSNKAALPKNNYPKFFQSLRFFLPYRRRIILLIGLEILSAAFLLAGPYFSKFYIDKAFLNKNMAAFLKITIFGAAVFLVSSVATLTRDIIKKKSSSRIKINLAGKFIKHLFSLDLSFFQSHSIGENFYRISDIDTISHFIAEDIPALVADLFKLTAIFSISLFLDYRLAAAMVILSPFFFLQSFKIRKKLRSLYEELWKSQIKLSKRLQEGLSRILVIKAFSLERLQRYAYMRFLIENIRLSLKIFRWSTFKSLATNIFSRLAYGMIALYGGWLIIKGSLSLGTYTAAMLYIGQIGILLEGFASRFEYFMQKTVAVEKFLEIVETTPGIKDSVDAVVIPSLSRDIVFDSVTFGYSADRPVFRNLNLRIPLGKWVGIAGPSGCGKTTLLNLILRLYEPQAGRILIGGYDIRNIKMDSLREKVAIATQEPLLFDLSIRENIAYGLSFLSDEGLYQALEVVRAGGFVKTLAQGIHTNIGENAAILSQGYKQRIALARAIVRNPELLLLDEATSSIDSQSEEGIFRSLRRERAVKSTIVISHRLFSIADADRIFFLTGTGRVEEGTHRELMEKSNEYREFFQAQLQEQAGSLRV
ncbi:MAG: ABC transporter ATP-binding protein [Candidatus Omnitrophota bacterium]